MSRVNVVVLDNLIFSTGQEIVGDCRVVNILSVISGPSGLGDF
jgi:hypothetical protein